MRSVAIALTMPRQVVVLIAPLTGTMTLRRQSRAATSLVPVGAGIRCGTDQELSRRSLRSLERLVERHHGFRPWLQPLGDLRRVRRLPQAEAAGR